jgi:Flp pilus assembly pilin Flp
MYQNQSCFKKTNGVGLTELLKDDCSIRQLFVLLSSDEGQDIAEYAVMVAVILLIVVGTLRIIGSNANTVFSQVASSIG